jgi:hypothetical protein
VTGVWLVSWGEAAGSRDEKGKVALYMHWCVSLEFVGRSYPASSARAKDEARFFEYSLEN